MNSPETNDPIEKLMREQDNYIADNGFTQKVMARLPQRRRSWRKFAVLALTAAGALAAVLFLPWSNLPPLDYTKVASLNSDVLSAWLPVAAVIVALGSTAMAALRRED